MDWYLTPPTGAARKSPKNLNALANEQRHLRRLEESLKGLG